MVPLTLTHTEIAHAWMFDAMGRLSSRHYLAMFDDALRRMMGVLGFDEVTHAPLAFADVKVEIEFLHEVRSGHVLRVNSDVKRVGRNSIATHHELTSPSGDIVFARCDIVSVQFDREQRQRVPVLDDLAAQARRFGATDDEGATT